MKKIIITMLISSMLLVACDASMESSQIINDTEESIMKEEASETESASMEVEENEEKKVTLVAIDPIQNLNPNDSAKLFLEEDEDQEVSVVWSSSDDNVVSVDDVGIITAKQSGCAEVTAEYGESKCTWKVYVGVEYTMLTEKVPYNMDLEYTVMTEKPDYIYIYPSGESEAVKKIRNVLVDDKNEWVKNVVSPSISRAEATVEYNQNGIFSVSVDKVDNGGGAWKATSIEGFTFDILTGKELDICEATNLNADEIFAKIQECVGSDWVYYVETEKKEYYSTPESEYEWCNNYMDKKAVNEINLSDLEYYINSENECVIMLGVNSANSYDMEYTFKY